MRRSRSIAALLVVAAPLALTAPPPASGQVERMACRSRITQRPCITVTNRASGPVFDFVTSRGDLGGRIRVGRGGDSRRPFTTNATGVATGLNADRLDGLGAEDIFRLSRQGVINLIRENFDPTRFLAAGGKAADSELLDGLDARAFLPARGKAADANLLDGKDSTAFLGAAAKATDANLLDGKDSTAFLGATAKAADADELDGLDSTELFPDSRALTAGGSGRLEMNIGDNGALVDDYGVRIDMHCVDSGGGVPGIQLELDTDENNTLAYAEGGGINGPALVVNAAGTGTLYEAAQGDVGQLVTVEVTVTKPDGVDVSGLLSLGFQLDGNDCRMTGTLLKTP